MKNNFDQPLFPPPGKTPREDTAAVMKFYKLPKAFPPEVLREARQISDPCSLIPLSRIVSI